jgi:hypothetical protein
MGTNTKTTLIAVGVCLLFGITALTTTVEMWDQRTRRRAAEGQLKTQMQSHKADLERLEKCMQDLRVCQSQPRVTVQTGKRNKVSSK